MLLGYLTVMVMALRFLSLIGEDGDAFTPTYLLLATWFAAGTDALLGWLRPRLARWRWGYPALLAVLCAVPLVSIVRHYPLAIRQQRLDAGVGLLAQPLPQGAVLAGPWTWVTPLLYAQRVEGVRPDLWVIHTDSDGIKPLLRQALAEQTPFYVIRSTATGPRLLPVPLTDTTRIGHLVGETGIRLGPAVRWRGYDLAPAAPRPGDTLQLTLYWAVDAPVGGDWTTFIHLVDERGEKVGQVDRLPVGDFYPPSAWQPGLLLADQYELTLPATLPPGRFRLVFGWYRGLERLKWADGADSRVLGEVVLP